MYFSSSDQTVLVWVSPGRTSRKSDLRHTVYLRYLMIVLEVGGGLVY